MLEGTYSGPGTAFASPTQLVDAVGLGTAAERYERKLEDVFAVRIGARSA